MMLNMVAQDGKLNKFSLLLPLFLPLLPLLKFINMYVLMSRECEIPQIKDITNIKSINVKVL